MATRYNAQSKTRFGVSGLPSGFGGKSSPELTIPSVGLEDVDVSLFTLFDKEIPLQVGGDEGTKDVPVVFASGEKWAVLKRGNALRDRNGSLILPLVTIGRSTVQQSLTEDITGRGINQQTGEIVVQRKLDHSDRAYQGLVNRLMIEHQLNLAVSPDSNPDDGQLTTLRSLGDLETDPTVQDGGLMLPDTLNNVYETIVLPSPQFYTAIYEVTLWTQYTQHMNQMIEQLVSSFLPQTQSWRLETKKGYWFVASVQENRFDSENNFDDITAKERIIKCKFTIKVPAYILATSVPGAPVPIKRYVSSPTISFDTSLDPSEAVGADDIDDPFLGADDPTLPTAERSRRRDQRETGTTRLYPGSDEKASPEDPALLALPRGRNPSQYKKTTFIDKNGNRVTKYLRISSVNAFTGETVFSSDVSLGGLTLVFDDD